MKTLKRLLLVFGLVVGLTITASAQSKGKDKKPPPKKDPPVVVVDRSKDKNRPKSKPKTRKKDKRKKPY